MQVFGGVSPGAWFEKAQQFGKSSMLPTTVLPATGLLLGTDRALLNPNTLTAYPFLSAGWLQTTFAIITSTGSIVSANLSVLFMVGVTMGLTKPDKGIAGLAALLAFLVMDIAINTLLTPNGTLAHRNPGSVDQGMTLGIQTLGTGMFGEVVIDLVARVLHSRPDKVLLPQSLGFSSGSCFVPIISPLTVMVVGTIMMVVWPHLQKLISGLGGLVDVAGYLGTLLYGFILRMFGPLGLHHIFHLPFWTTALGSSEIASGQLVEDMQRIFFTRLADPNTQQFHAGTTHFVFEHFIAMMFGLPGAHLAMYYTTKPEDRKVVAGLLLSAALIFFLMGTTEPVEFPSLSITSVSYIVHAFSDGLASMVAHVLHITIGQTFLDRLVDLLLFGMLQGESKTNWMYVPIMGVPWFFLYRFTFRYPINRFDWLTPNRENVALVESDQPQNEYTAAVTTGLGDRENLEEADCCATRLHVTVKGSSKVGEVALKVTGMYGAIIRGNGAQVVYGLCATITRNETEEILS